MTWTPSAQPLRQGDLRLMDKARQIRWMFILAICTAASVGIVMLYSAGGGSAHPWAVKQLARFLLALAVMLSVAVTDIRLWLRSAYPLYFAGLVLLVIVDVFGIVGMGAQRWIDLGVINLQPSEVMKIALVLALARYFQGLGADDMGRPWKLFVPVLMIVIPVALVIKQPDLGTGMMLLLGGAAVFFAAGVRLWMFAAVILGGMAAVPVAWEFLHDYQRRRVLTFLDPESDPLGSGYHILQSKIALGSGGVFGKGFMQGTQSHLNFLPEKQTDFIFTMIAEEFGLIGSLGMLTLYAVILGYCFTIALSARNQFGRLLAIGMSTTFFLYLFINMAMVMGLIPVVGVPLPLVSYGGTAILSLMLGFGLVMSVHVHRHVTIGRHATGD